jgi:hypothetical protein
MEMARARAVSIGCFAASPVETANTRFPTCHVIMTVDIPALVVTEISPNVFGTGRKCVWRYATASFAVVTGGFVVPTALTLIFQRTFTPQNV